jgi:hypothetical protein
MTEYINKNFDLNYFNHLEDIEDVALLDLDAKSDQVGELIVRHGLSDVVAVTRLHKHFNLQEGEGVIMSVIDNILRFDVDKLYNNDISVLPYTWGIKNGKLTPLQFAVSSESLEQKFDRLCQAGTFFSDLIILLQEMDAEHELGISLIIHTLLDYDYDNMTLVEGTSVSHRWQEMRPKLNSHSSLEESVTTHWIYEPYMSLDGDLPVRKHRCACLYGCLPRDGHEKEHYEFHLC